MSFNFMAAVILKPQKIKSDTVSLYQFSSVAKLCLTLCNPYIGRCKLFIVMDLSKYQNWPLATPGNRLYHRSKVPTKAANKILGC